MLLQPLLYLSVIETITFRRYHKATALAEQCLVVLSQKQANLHLSCWNGN